MRTFKLLLCCFFFIGFQSSCAQRICGKVSEAETSKGISLVTVCFANSEEATVTNLAGNFTINTLEKPSSTDLVFHALGYKSQSLSPKDYKENAEVKLIPFAPQLKTENLPKARAYVQKALNKKAYPLNGMLYFQQQSLENKHATQVTEACFYTNSQNRGNIQQRLLLLEEKKFDAGAKNTQGARQLMASMLRPSINLGETLTDILNDSLTIFSYEASTKLQGHEIVVVNFSLKNSRTKGKLYIEKTSQQLVGWDYETTPLGLKQRLTLSGFQVSAPIQSHKVRYWKHGEHWIPLSTFQSIRLRLSKRHVSSPSKTAVLQTNLLTFFLSHDKVVPITEKQRLVKEKPLAEQLHPLPDFTWKNVRRIPLE